MNDKLTDLEIVKALEIAIEKQREISKVFGLPTNMLARLNIDCLDLINRLQKENENLKLDIATLEAKNFVKDKLLVKAEEKFKNFDIQLEVSKKIEKEIKAEAYKEFWNSRPERLNEQCEGNEEYNKGWNACLDEFWEIRNNLFEELAGD